MKYSRYSDFSFLQVKDMISYHAENVLWEDTFSSCFRELPDFLYGQVLLFALKFVLLYR